MELAASRRKVQGVCSQYVDRLCPNCSVSSRKRGRSIDCEGADPENKGGREIDETVWISLNISLLGKVEDRVRLWVDSVQPHVRL